MKITPKIATSALLLTILILSGCKKEYVEPFEWYITGNFNGTATAFQVDKTTDASANDLTWQCNAIQAEGEWGNCDPSAPGLWIEESKFHNYPSAVDTPSRAYEASFSLVRRWCWPHPDSTSETWTRDSLWLPGTYAVLDSLDNSDGFIIEYRNGPDVWSSAGGVQPSGMTVKITKQVLIESQEDWKFICEADFNCVLYKEGSSEIITITDGKYRGRTVTPWE